MFQDSVVYRNSVTLSHATHAPRSRGSHSDSDAETQGFFENDRPDRTKRARTILSHRHESLRVSVVAGNGLLSDTQDIERGSNRSNR